MSTDLVPLDNPGPESSFSRRLVQAAAAVPLLQAVLSGRNARTVRAYESDYRDFAAFLGAGSAGEALDALVALPKPAAQATVLGYRAQLVERQLASSTIARRLAALRSAVRLARLLGRVEWQLDVEAPRVDPYRDTRGPGRDGWRDVLGVAAAEAVGPRGRRDLAIVRLLHDVALRRAEVLALDLADVDLERSTVAVLGKGKTAKAPVTIPSPTRGAIADWLAVRGLEPGPLFIRLDNAAGDNERLTGRMVHKLVARLGRLAGLSRPLRPHGLRHQGITRALDVTGGDVRAVKRFSRHAKVETLMRYDDNRQDLAGKIADLVAGD